MNNLRFNFTPRQKMFPEFNNGHFREGQQQLNKRLPIEILGRCG